MGYGSCRGRRGTSVACVQQAQGLHAHNVGTLLAGEGEVARGLQGENRGGYTPKASERSVWF